MTKYLLAALLGCVSGCGGGDVEEDFLYATVCPPAPNFPASEVGGIETYCDLWVKND